MNELKLLQSMEKMLQEEEFDCSVEPHAKAPPFGRLLVFLGNDPKARERILEITTQEQELGESLKEKPTEPQFNRVQFEIALPFTLKDYAANEVNSLLAFLNRMLDLPGFELDEINSCIFYRYVLLTSKEEITKLLLLPRKTSTVQSVLSEGESLGKPQG